MKRFLAEDIKKLNYVSWPFISDNGLVRGCVKFCAEESTGNFKSAIYLIENGKEICLTESGHSESQPVFSHDGKTLYYLSGESGENQVWSRDLISNKKRKLTTLRHGIERFTLSETENLLAFEAVLWNEEISSGTFCIEMTSDEKAEFEAELDMMPYEIEKLVYKKDEWFGMRHGEFSHIGVLDLNNNSYEMVDSGETEVCYPAFSHDENYLAFHGYPHGGALGLTAEIFLWNRSDKTLTQLTDNIGIYADHSPIFTNDDKAVISSGYPPFEDGSTDLLPYLIDIDTKNFRYLIDENLEEPTLHPLAACRTEFGPEAYFMTLDSNGKNLYFHGYKQGNGIVCKVALDNPKQIETVVSSDLDIHMFSLSKNGDILYTGATPLMPPELYFENNRLTFSNDWLNDYELGETKAYSVLSKDGKAELPYYITYPPQFDPTKKYPAILECKGGPETVTGLSFWHEFQAEAAQDFVVITGNPRGSTGYGRKFNSGAVCWMKEAMEDQLSFVDDAVKKCFIDENKIGVTGGSYGGYMTMKLIGRTDKFSAAVAQRALANPVTSYGTGDMGFVSSREIPNDFTMKAYLDDRAEDNVISYIDNMKTPLLILHAAKDYRCGFEQAEQIFIAMKDRNPEVPVRLVRFPNENHALTRTGKLHYQIRHLKELVNWFCKYLKKEEN